jgi:hypothetical protein
VANDVFARWKLTRTGSVEEVGDTFFIKESAPVDAVYDTLYEFSLGGITARNASHVLIEEAMAAYATANRGQRPPTADELRPYLNSPVDEAMLGAMLQNPVPQ